MDDEDIVTPGIEFAPCFESDRNRLQFLARLECQVSDEREALVLDEVGVVVWRRVVVQYCFQN